MIDSFKDEYSFLSNFYRTSVMYKNMMFTSSEAAYQSQKTLNGINQLKFTKLNPFQAKKAGVNVLIRPDWEQIKDQVMEDCVRDKFTRNLDLRQLLLETGDEELVEGNDWGDTYWGVCNGKGKNMLGKILMKVREEFR